MKLTVSETGGIGQIFAAQPRTFASLGGMVKALMDVAINALSVVIRGFDENGNATILRTAKKFGIYQLDDAYALQQANEVLNPTGKFNSLQSPGGRLKYDWRDNAGSPVVSELTLAEMIDALQAAGAQEDVSTLGNRVQSFQNTTGYGGPFAMVVNQTIGQINLCGSGDATSNNAKLVVVAIGETFTWE